MIEMPLIIPAGGLQNISRFVPPVVPEESDTPIATTYLGTPVYSNIIFSGNGVTEQINLETVMIEVVQEKHIIKTPIQGRKGTVKDYISLGDYQITIRGLIVSPFANVMPKAEIEAFRELLELDESLEIASEFLQMFSVHNIAVERFSFGQMEGYRNQVPFMISAVSDEPIEVREI